MDGLTNRPLLTDHWLVRLRTWPLKGMEARFRSKADCRSVEMRMSESAVVYTSRTLPVGWGGGEV